jgi:hypothetical protein
MAKAETMRTKTIIAATTLSALMYGCTSGNDEKALDMRIDPDELLTAAKEAVENNEK